MDGDLKKNKLPISFIIALIVSLIAIVSFILPYISSTEKYREYLESQGDKHASDSVDMTYRDMKDISLFEYAKTYFQGGKEILHDETAGIFYGVLMSSVGVFSILVLLAVLRKKPILTFILNALLGGVCYLVNWDFVDRGIMPSSNYVWGISYYMLYACIAVIAFCAIWMFVAKRKIKKRRQRYSGIKYTDE